MQNTPGKTGSPLGHVDFVTIELAGLLYGRIQTEVGIKLLWGRKQVKGTHFRDQYDRAEEADTPQRLEKEDAVIDQCPCQFFNSLMQLLKYAVQMLLIFPVGFDIQPDTECIAGKRMSEKSGVLCGGKHVCGKGEGLQKL